MPDKGTKKKVTRIEGGETEAAEPKTFEVTEESSKKAKTFRIIAFLCWIIAIGFEIYSIVILRRPPVNMTLLIVFIIAALIFAIAGSLLWKKSNRLDPASEREKVKFFIQNQLGVIISIIAFLPLIILIFTSKDLKGKQKGLVGAVAVIAMVIAGFLGIDFNPPSIEQYTEQTAQVESLTGANFVYWTKSGTRYHIYSDCRYINTDRTEEIFEGTVAQARELKNITQLCSACRFRAEKDKNLTSHQTTGSEEDIE